MEETIKVPRTRHLVTCYDKDGQIKWQDEARNIVFDEGINNLINAYFKGTNYTASFYVGLLASGAVLAATDTAASHPGWTEFVAYVSGQRSPLVLGPTGNKTTDNSSNKATFTLNDAGTIAGAFITTSAAKGQNTGTIYSGALFTSGPKALVSGDTLGVTTIISGA